MTLPASDDTLNKLGIVGVRGHRKDGSWIVVIRTREWIEIVAEADTFDDALDHAVAELVSNPETLPN